MTGTEGQVYIDAMAAERGYVPDYHKIMARHDFGVLQATNGLVRAAYEDSRALDPKIKELLFIVSLTALRAGSGFLASHIQRSQDLGTSAQEILEAIELVLPVAGMVAFLSGFEAWRQVNSATGIEPSATPR